MNRRNVIGASATVLASLATASAWAASKKTGSSHQHPASGASTPEHCQEHGSASAVSQDLLQALSRCIVASDVCLAHCIDLMSHGDTSMAACARRVTETRALCEAMLTLASQKSPLLPRLSAVAKDACKACEDECRKHAAHHQACKNCAEACAACLQACESAG
ncbi:MAG: four-helix bundle copper-binding protein [Aquabacterium sp.]